MAFSKFKSGMGVFQEGARIFRQRPLLAAGTGLAALTAPAFLKNDDRGYLGTAAVTTPLVVAGALGMQNLYGAAMANGGKLYSFTRRGKEVWSKTPVNPTSAQMAGMAANPDVTPGDMSRMAAKYYQKKPNASKYFDPHHLKKRVRADFGKLSQMEDKHSLLSNAIQNAEIYARSTADAAAAPAGFTDELAELSIEEMRSYFNSAHPKSELLNNEKFLKRLNRNLNRAKKLIDPGAPGAGNSIPFTRSAPIVHRELGTAGIAMEHLAGYSPKVAEELLKYKSKEGGFAGFSSVKLISEDVVDGTIGHVLGISFTKGKGKKAREFMTPIINPKTGEVRMGQGFSVRGAGRNIYNQHGSLPGDVFMIRNLDQDWTREEMTMLRKERSRYAIFNSKDPLDTFSQTRMAGAEDGLTLTEIKLRSQQHVPTLRPQFENLKMEPVPHSALDAQERILLERKLDTEFNLPKLSSPGSYGKGVRDSFETLGLHFGGAINYSNQMPEYRALSKNFHLVSDPQGIPSKRVAPFLETTMTQEMFGTNPAAGMRVGGVSPLAATVFGDLPKDLAKLEKGRDRFVNHLTHVGGISERNADRAWRRVLKRIQTEDDLAAARRLGRLGEGGFMVQEGFGGHTNERISTYKVNSLRLSETDRVSLSKDPFGRKRILGYSSNGEAITARGHRNYIKSITSGPDGSHTIMVKEHFKVGDGTKWDFLSVKGLGISAGNPHDVTAMEKTRFLLNDFNEATAKNGQVIPHLGPDVNALALTNFMHEKADPVHSILGSAAGTLRRIENLEQVKGFEELKGKFPTQAEKMDRGPIKAIAERYKAKFAELNSVFTEGRFLEDSRLIHAMPEAARRERIQNLVDLSREMMDEVGQHIRDRGGYNDSHFINFRRGLTNLKGKPLKHDDFLQYTTLSGLEGNAYAWNTSHVDTPKRVKLTFDMQGQIYANGYHDVLKDLQGKLKYPQGDASQARSLMEHVLQGDFSQEFGKSLTLEEAFPEGARGSMRTASARLGTIFDPDNATARSNFSLDLGEGAKHRYIPVLGHDAFKGSANHFGDAGEFSSNEFEKGIRRIATTTGTERDTAVQSYLDTLRNEMYGKKGYLRADAVHTQATSGFIQTMASTLPAMQDGRANPFEVAIGPDMAKKAGLVDGQYAMMTRHPVSSTPFVRVRIDNNLKGSNLMGLDVGLHASVHADDDGDLGYLFAITRGSAAERTARRAVHRSDSLQHVQLRVSAAMQGIGDDTRRIPGGQVDFEKNLTKFMTNHAERVSIMGDRTTGNAVGEFSNILTRMQLQLEHTTAFRGLDKERSALSEVLWQVTRQSPIAAQKNSSGFNLVMAQEFSKKLNYGLKTKGAKGVTTLHSAFLDITAKLEKETAWIPEMKEMLGIDGQSGDVLKPMQTWLQQSGRQELERLHASLNPNVDQFHHMVTRSKDVMASTGYARLDAAHQAMGDIAPYMQGASRSGSSAAHASAESIGAVNEAISSVKQGASTFNEKLHETVQAVKGDMDLSTALKFAGAGIGLAALAGVMTSRTTSLDPSFDRRSSGNSFRPEEVAGAQDYIPGEPAAGSRSASAPPRRAHDAPAEPRSTYVAPMQSAVDVDVQMRGDNRQDGVERMKLAARMAGGGNGSMTLINRDATRAGSLRFQSQMRDTLRS